MRIRLSWLWILALTVGCLAQPAPDAPPRWDMAALASPPQVFAAPGFVEEGVQALFYEGATYRGQPTRVFAWYGAPARTDAGPRFPAVVLVHGGGGTAFAAWVRLWTSRGYAALAMDLCGAVPRGTYGNWQRHAQGGPPGWGGFDQIDEPATDQWTYHALAGIVLGHSLLRTLPGVDPDRIGVTGISWGGYLTCIVAGVDGRFRCAVPVYGCGFLGENSAWLGEFARLGPGKAGRWLAWWDPSRFLAEAHLPMLWINGSNDFAYPMDSWQKSYRAAPGPRVLCLKVRMPHGHGGAGENPEEIHAFMKAHLDGGPPLAQVIDSGREGMRVWALARGVTPMARAELNFTRDTGRWQDRKWETAPAAFDAGSGRATAVVPDGASVCYLNFVDAAGRIVSAEHEAWP